MGETHMLFWTGKNKKILESRVLRPATTDITNPGRGWYHIYTFRLGQPDNEQLKWQPYYETETLVLVRLELRDFKDRPLDEAALSYADEILSTFAQHKKDVILRACYDIDGKGLLREPASFSVVLGHLRQIGELARVHAAHIYTAQGLLVGSWGEMHTSRYLDPMQLQRMAKVWSKATQGSVVLSVRKPCYMRMMPNESQIGLYDDALCSNATHMGTFGEKPQKEALWEEAWRPQEELAFLAEKSGYAPNGGEAVAGEEYSPEEILTQLEQMHISYLNSVHDPMRIEPWKTQMLPSGISLYDEIGMRLGYRFTVRKAVVKQQTCSVTIANEGFAPIGMQAKLFFLCGKEEIAIDYDLCNLKPQKSVTVCADIEETGTLGIGMRQKKDGRVIRFANEGAQDVLILGELTGK